MRRISIAIDGPSGAGKSTLAKAIAKSMGIHYLDTGAMYRAVGYAAIKKGVNIGNSIAVEGLMNKLDLRVKYEGDEQLVLIDGENVMPFIRTSEISKAASDVSAHPCVRTRLAAMQRETAKEYDIVLDGRDIGTYVLPDAPFKFFITADAEERARRRYLELKEKGMDADYEEVLRGINERDKNDSSRALAPLKKADDAILVDTTNMSAEKVLSTVLSAVRERSDVL